MTGRVRLLPARVVVPGSTSNLGAGFDCIGMAVDRHLDVTFEPGGAELGLERHGTLVQLGIPHSDDLLLNTFAAALRRCGVADAAGVLRAWSDIPVGRGLGSSGAAVVAALTLAAAVAGGAVLPAEVVAEAIRLEGHPDNATAAVLGGLVATAPRLPEQAEWRVFRLPLSKELAFAFAAPVVEIETAQARHALPRRVAHEVAARAAARAVALVRGLADGDPQLLRIGFDDELHVPYRLPLIPGAIAAMDAAREAGAWAATISGSGSGLIAVCAPGSEAEIVRAMKAALECDGGGGDVVAFPLMPEERGARQVAPGAEAE